MATLVGSLLISMGLDSGQFKSGMDATEKRLARAQKSFERFGQNLQSVGQKLSLGVTVPLVALTGGLLRASVKSLEFASSLGEVAQQLGVSTRDLQEYRYAATQVGISQEEMDKSLAKLTRTLGEASAGAAKPTAVFEQLGIDITDASGRIKSAGAIIPEIADALAKIPDPAARAAVEVALFGKAGQKLETLLSGGAKGINNLRDAAQKLGVVLSDADIQKADDAADKLAGLKTILQAKFASSIVEHLPVIEKAMTGVFEAADKLLTAFGKLSPEMQIFAIGAAAVAAALGPVLFVLGGLVKFAAPFLATIKVINASIIGAGASSAVSATGFAAFKAGLVALAGAAVPFLPVIGAVAAVAGLIYSQWDKIAPVLTNIGAQFQATLGPSLQGLIETLSSSLTALWEGPLGTAIKAVGGFLGEFLVILLEVFGTVTIASVASLFDAISGFVTFVGQSFKFIGQVLTGDFAGAWETMQAAVGNAVSTVLKIISNFSGFSVAQIKNMVAGIQQWIVGGLGKVWTIMNAQIDKAKKAFFDLYDAVVGNSYIPDMVDEIGQNISRLQQLMVGPIDKMTKKSAEAFRALQSDVAGILNRLYPEQARENTFLKELKSLQSLMKAMPKDAEQLSSAIEALRTEFFQERIGRLLEATPIAISNTDLIDNEVIERFNKSAWKIADAAAKSGKSIKATNVNIVKSFKDMADETLGSISNLANGIRGGGIVDILQGVLGLFTQLASIGTFGKGLQATVNAPARALGGPVTGGKTYLVGERGPELFTASQSGSIIPNNKIGGGGSNIRVMVEASPYFNATVDQRASNVAAPMAVRAGLAGASLAENNLARRSRSRIP